MADSIRKAILLNLEATLAGVPALNSVGIGTFELYKVVRPAAGIIPIEETTESQPETTYVESLAVKIRVVVDEGYDRAALELEDVLTAVHQAVLADPNRDGLAANTVKTGTDYLFTDEHYPRAGADLRLLITFATDEKDPTLSNLV